MGIQYEDDKSIIEVDFQNKDKSFAKEVLKLLEVEDLFSEIND